MAFLTLGGIDLRVLEGSAHEHPSLYQGATGRMYANNSISTIDPTTRKRVFECTVDLYDAGEESALRAACLPGDEVVASGDWLNGATLYVIVVIGDANPFQVRDLGGDLIYKEVSLHFEEA